MHIFETYEAFFGSMDLAQTNSQLEPLLELMGALGKKLGKKGYLLGEYVQQILQAAAQPTLHSVVACAHTDARALRGLIAAILSNQPMDHPLYEVFRQEVEGYTLPYQECATCQAVQFILLADQVQEHILKLQYVQLYPVWRKLDSPALRAMSEQLSHLLGEKDMHRLNHALRQRFFTLTPVAAIQQTIANELAQAMTALDPEGREYCVQLAAQTLNRPAAGG